MKRKQKYHFKTFALAMGSVLLPLLFLQGIGEEVPRPDASDFNSPTLGVNTLRFNGNLIVTATDKAGRRFGFNVGDVITEVEGQSVKSVSDMIKAVENKKVNARVQVLLTRAENAVSIKRKFRGFIRGDNGELQVDESIERVGNYARIKPSKKKVAKKKTRKRKTNKSLARVRTAK